MTALDYLRSHTKELSGSGAVAAISIMIAAAFAGSTIMTPLYVIYQQELGFSQITLTLIYAAYVVGNLLALFLFGRLSDKFGRRRTALPAIGVMIISALVFLFEQGTVSLYLGRALSGLGIAVGAGTATAWIAELIGEEDKTRATVITTSANFLGLAGGALVSGLLAQYAPSPLALPFVVYMALLGVVAILPALTRETVSRPIEDPGATSLWPRLSVPREIRAQFVAPAVAGFGAMALAGFYSALVPTILIQHLHETSHAVAGALVFEMSAVAALSIVATQAVESREAMLWALGLMVPSVILVVAAQMLESMPVLVIATAVCGLASGLGYRGSLQVVNQIAPAEQRAEVVSSYFLCGFSGNALPVIGIGVLASLSSSNTASMAFAGMLILFAAIALAFGIKYKT